jgi:hypothetical protein
MEPIISRSSSSSEFEENISNDGQVDNGASVEQVDNGANVEQVDNGVKPSEDSIFSDRVKLIAKIAIPIIIAVILFAAIPFVAEAGAIGLGLTGLFFIAVGVYSLLTGEGLERLKAWGKEQQELADKAKQKQNVDVVEQNTDEDESDSSSLSVK